MNNYDLDITNYSVSELKQLLNINNNTNTIDIDLLNKKKIELHTRFDTHNEHNEQFKTRFERFLNQATDILMKSFNIEEHKYHHNILANNDVNPSHPIIHIPKTPFIYSQPSEGFQGKINPLERRIVTKILSIDSEFRQNPAVTNSNKFIFQLQTPLDNVISMNLVALELPILWHSISSKLENNSFKINLYNMTAFPNISVIITLPDGNYTNANLSNSINIYLSNNTNGLQYISFNINSVTGKACFYVNVNLNDSTNSGTYSPNFYYELDFTDNYYRLGNYMGFTKTHYKATMENIFEDSFFAKPPIVYYCYTLAESSCGNFDNYIFIAINDFNNSQESNTIISQTNEGYIGNNVIGRITLNSAPDSLLVNNASDRIFKKREYYGPVRIKQLEITLLNKYNKLIEMLQNNFSLALELQILYSP